MQLLLRGGILHEVFQILGIHFSPDTTKLQNPTVMFQLVRPLHTTVYT